LLKFIRGRPLEVLGVLLYSGERVTEKKEGSCVAGQLANSGERDTAKE
jgi:hypothetical protein